MGCISSKAITRSMSIREELRSSAVSVSVWEELLTSSHSHSHRHSGNDQLLAFVLKTRPTTDSQAEVETAPDVAVKFTRSRSCHTQEENRWDDLDDKKVGGSRSFHTVEEYDALLERIGRLQSLEDENENENDELEVEVDRESGWKRKAVARGLKSLEMELPSIARIKQQAQIYSPGTYVTPKFGTYNNYNYNYNANANAQTPFSPELVAAFEDSMQQLQLEEDCFLRHIDEEDYIKHDVK
ncbi:hypothetical protein C2S51_014080 [Perilla frutescens var. frutescens]|nr:hypothetical protein C2S51_014080 [Perilla frutescens var. frutescens]